MTLQRVKWLNFGPGKVIIRWVPGHSGIKGNEAADEEARAAAEEAARMPKEGPATLAWTNRAAKESKVAAFQVYWESNAPQRYKDLGIRAAKKPPELRLRRFHPRQTVCVPFGTRRLRRIPPTTRSRGC